MPPSGAAATTGAEPAGDWVARTVVVRDLGPTVTADVLRAAFSQFGHVERAAVPVEPLRREPAGYGLVQFHDAATAGRVAADCGAQMLMLGGTPRPVAVGPLSADAELMGQDAYALAEQQLRVAWRGAAQEAGDGPGRAPTASLSELLPTAAPDDSPAALEVAYLQRLRLLMEKQQRERQVLSSLQRAEEEALAAQQQSDYEAAARTADLLFQLDQAAGRRR